MRLNRFLHFAAGLLLIAFAGCKPPPESIKMKERVNGPPDLVRDANWNDANQAYQLRAFHLNHIWAGANGREESTQAYRSKVTLWDYSDTESAIAELYFDDTPDTKAANIPDPNRTKPPYRIHFPMTALGPIMATLRSTNEPTFLYFYEGNWAVGTYSAEPVGSE